MELYLEGRLSLDKAAELAGAKSKWEMLMLLSDGECLWTIQQRCGK